MTYYNNPWKKDEVWHATVLIGVTFTIRVSRHSAPKQKRSMQNHNFGLYCEISECLPNEVNLYPLNRELRSQHEDCFKADVKHECTRLFSCYAAWTEELLIHFKPIICKVLHLFNPVNANGFKSRRGVILRFTLMRQFKLILNLVCSPTSFFPHLNSGDDYILLKEWSEVIYFWWEIGPIFLN